MEIKQKGGKHEKELENKRIQKHGIKDAGVEKMMELRKM